jgi:methylglyoxal synthase
VSGDVEISSIGKEQLKMMLFYVDPYEQNPTIRDIRGALNVGEVRRVSIPLRNGEVGMDVDVRVLAAPIPTPKLQRFPIRQILQNFKDQAKAG